MSGLNFNKLSKAILTRSAQIYPQCQQWTPTDWACALGGEVGEALNLIKKLHRDDPGGNARALMIEQLGEELADVISYVVFVAAQFDIDLDEAVVGKFNRVSDKKNSSIKL